MIPVRNDLAIAARFGSRSSRSAASWHGCAVFKVRKEARAPDWSARSLKTQQHAPRVPACGAVDRVRIGVARKWAEWVPGPVDVSRTVSSSGGAVCAAGASRRSTPGAP